MPKVAVMPKQSAMPKPHPRYKLLAAQMRSLGLSVAADDYERIDEFCGPGATEFLQSLGISPMFARK